MYTISDERTQEITFSATGNRWALTLDEVEAFCLADWPEGDEHQEWLDTADADAIAEWIAAGRTNE